MKFVLIGIQGSGKSTQGNLLSKMLKIPYLSTGHIFREIAKERTTLGRYIKETINSGILVPDDKAIEIANDYLSRPEYKRGYILDGFPRTVKQVEKFKNNVDKVIYLNISDKEALWRIINRDEKREDETLPAIRKRIEMYHLFTDPVIEYYREKGILLDIDATKPIEEVNKQILGGLGKQFVENKVIEWKPKKTVLAIVGLPGVGKTEAGDFFKMKGLAVISFGKIINDYIDQQGFTHTEEVHKKVREDLRAKHGKEVLAVMNKENIQKELKKNPIVVIDGMRSWEEYLYLKKELKNVRVLILAIFVDKSKRNLRASKRTYRSRLYGEERDINELIGTNMGPTIAYADFLIKNNFSKKDFYDKLEAVYREVYFA